MKAQDYAGVVASHPWRRILQDEVVVDQSS